MSISQWFDGLEVLTWGVISAYLQRGINLIGPKFDTKIGSTGGGLLEKNFVNKIEQAEWNQHTKKRVARGANPDLRWCYLVDSTKNSSHGISVGCLIIPVEDELPLHTHAPQEVYLIKSGSGRLLMPNGKSRSVSESDCVYIPNNEKYGLSNTGDTPLKVIWIFPTDCWKDVEYIYSDV